MNFFLVWSLIISSYYNMVLSQGTSSSGQCQDSKWFGHRCRQRCNCLSLKSCPMCTNKTTVCQKGYFGIQCQYKDILNEQCSTIDLDDNSRIRRPHSFAIFIQSPLIIYLGYNVFFTWMQLCYITNVSSDKVNISVSFEKLHDGNYIEVHCKLSRLNLINEGCVIIRCTPYITVAKLNIYYQGFRHFDQVYVSGGVNMALRQRVIIGKRNESIYQYPEDVVDQLVYTRCTSYRNSRKRLPMFQLILKEALWIQRIVVATTKADVLHLSVSVTDEKNEVLRPMVKYIGTSTPATKFSCYLYSFLVPTLRRSRKLNVFGADLDDNESMTLCDIYVYSECLFPNYGPTCEDVCSIGCVALSCHTTGDCFNCLPGMKGRLCLQSAIGQTGVKNDSESFEESEKPIKKHGQKSYYLFVGMDLIWAVAFGGIVFVSSSMCLLYISCNVVFSTDNIAKKSRSVASYMSSKTSSVRQYSAVSSHISSVNEIYQKPSRLSSFVSDDSRETDV